MKGLNNECRFFLFLGVAAILAIFWLLIVSAVGLAGDTPPATSQPTDSNPTSVPPPAGTPLPPPPPPPSTDISPTNLPPATEIVPPPAEATPDSKPNDNSHKRSPKPTPTVVETFPVTGFAEVGNFPKMIILLPVLLGIAWLARLARRENYHDR